MGPTIRQGTPEGGGAPWWVVPTQVPPPVVLGSRNYILLYKNSLQSFVLIQELLFLHKNNTMVVLLKTMSVRVSFIQIMQIRVQNKSTSVRKSKYNGDVSLEDKIKQLHKQRAKSVFTHPSPESSLILNWRDVP